MAQSADPVTIKRYGRRRLYNPVLAAYVTLDDLAVMVEDDEDFRVTEAETGEDITPIVLRQIISARGRHG
jgi:polyhydroxyalkanoate synthesis repressor PhaR